MTGHELKALREKEGLKLPELVRRVKIYGLTSWQIFWWENGNRRILEATGRILSRLFEPKATSQKR